MADDRTALTLKAIQFWASKARTVLVADSTDIACKYDMSEADIDTLAVDIGVMMARTLIEGTLGQA